jgi:hypothetical protein
MAKQDIPTILRSLESPLGSDRAWVIKAADEIDRLTAIVDRVVEYGKARKDMIALCCNRGADVSDVDRIAFEVACCRQMEAFRRVIQCCDDAANAAEGKL